MKSEPKPFASLSSGLLARKGGARPAMRPQGFGQIGGNLEDLGWNDMGFEAPKPAEAPRDEEHDAFGEPIAEHPALHGHAGLTPVNSPVHTQQAEIEDRFKEPEDSSDEGEELDETAEIVEEHDELPMQQPVEARAPMFVVPSAPAPVARRAPRPRSAPGSKGKAAFTLRLDPERHLKLRLACAVSGRSAQLLVTDALDQFLGGMPELEAMAGKAKRKG
ncbi:MAG: hypothetical protein HOP96_06300 [Sphingomonas sp.]|nr:hypothetical protein [Sphingomonas sp.]